MRARDAIANYWLGEGGECLEDAYPRHRQVAYDRADEIIAALRAAGFELCPVNPTTAMKHAGRIMNSKIGEDMAEACYRAMISAAKEQT